MIVILCWDELERKQSQSVSTFPQMNCRKLSQTSIRRLLQMTWACHLGNVSLTCWFLVQYVFPTH